MQLWRHVADVFLYVPNAFTASSCVSEESDVAGIALRIVSTDKAEKGRLAGSVLPAQCPSLTVHDCPVEFFQYGATSVAYAYLVHLDHFLVVIFSIAVGQVDNGLLLDGRKDMLRNRLA